jgi:hypothetical protein
MTYLEPKEIVKLKRFSKAHKIPMAQIIREAIYARLASGNQYTSGFNEGLAKASKVVHGIDAAQMRFPSGMSFAELIDTEISKHVIREGAEHEADGQP